MNPLVGVTFAWVVIHVFVGVSFVLLGVVRGAGSEYTLFGLLALVAGVFAVATGLHYSSINDVGWAGVRLAAGTTTIAMGLDLAVRLGEMRVRLGAVVRGAYGYAVAVAGLAASGRWFAGHHSVRHVGHGLFAMEYHNADANRFGVLAITPAPALMALTIYVLLRAALRGERWMWPVTLSVAVGVVAGAADLATFALHLRLPYLTEHAMFVVVFGISYALMGRLVERASVSAQELDRSRKSLAAVRNTLAEREPLALVGELSAIVAHEIRNPLGVITNAASSLRRPELHPKDRSLLLEIVSEECQRLNRIVTDMLALARPINIQRRPVDVRELVERSLSPARRDRTSVELEVRFADGADGALLCDGSLLRQALENVVDNAVQAMDSGGTLTVEVTQCTRGDCAGWEFAVMDSGEGMNTEVRNRATRPFFTTRTTGTGLGLAIVDKILVSHGGGLHIESTRGAGTTVRLFVPEA